MPDSIRATRNKYKIIGPWVTLTEDGLRHPYALRGSSNILGVVTTGLGVVFLLFIGNIGLIFKIFFTK